MPDPVTTPVRLLLVGVGGHGRTWAHAVSRSPQLARAVAVVDPDPVALAEAGDKLAVPGSACFARLDDALARAGDLELRAAILVTPPRLHREHALACLDAGLDVLVEKPVAETLDDAVAMADAADRAGRLLGVVQQRRWAPGPRTLKRLLDAGDVGTLTHGHVDFHLPINFTGGFRKTMPHVLLLDMTVHHVDLVRFLAARDVRRVYAVDFNPAGSTTAGQCAAKMILELDGGVCFSYSADWSARGIRNDWHGGWRLQGDRGCLTYDGDAAGATVTLGGTGDALGGTGDAPVTTRHVPVASADRSMFELLLGDFLRSVRDGSPFPTAVRANLNTIATILAAVESAETGRRVDVPDHATGSG